MADPILGDVSESEDGTRHATLTLGGRDVELSVYPDGGDPEAAMQFARNIASELAERDRLARAKAADRLLETYNEGWREYSDVDEAGNEFEVTGPELTAEQFIARCTLASINVTGADGCDFFYDADGMFWGHSIVVATSDGGRSWKNVQLFG